MGLGLKNRPANRLRTFAGPLSSAQLYLSWRVGFDVGRMYADKSLEWNKS